MSFKRSHHVHIFNCKLAAKWNAESESLLKYSGVSNRGERANVRLLECRPIGERKWKANTQHQIY